MAEIDVDGIHAVREFLRMALGERLGDAWLEAYRTLQTQRAVSLRCRAGRAAHAQGTGACYLWQAGGGRPPPLPRQFRGADNMTDTIAALGLLAESDLPERAAALADFYARWRDDALVIDKWFALQAMAQRGRARRR